MNTSWLKLGTFICSGVRKDHICKLREIYGTEHFWDLHGFENYHQIKAAGEC